MKNNVFIFKVFKNAPALHFFILACVFVMAACAKNQPAAPDNTPIQAGTNTATVSCTPTLAFTYTETLTPTEDMTATGTNTLSCTPTQTVTDTVIPTPTNTQTPVFLQIAGVYRWGDGSCAGSCYEYNMGGPSVTGLYDIEQNGTTITTMCDMVTDGGGWTLVLYNGPYDGVMAKNWDESINGVNVLGDISGGENAFDLFIGLSFWEGIASHQGKLRLEVSNTSMIGNPLLMSKMDFNFDEAAEYVINLSNLVNMTGTTAPGLYSYHNGMPFSTSDNDNDSFSGNCSAQYSGIPWWYGQCWSGCFLGSVGGAYAAKAYWTGSAPPYYDFGMMWVR